MQVSNSEKNPTAVSSKPKPDPAQEKSRRRASNTLILLGLAVISFPLLTEVYGAFVQSRLNQSWEKQVALQQQQAAEAQAQQIGRLGTRTVATEDTVLKTAIGPLTKGDDKELPPTKIRIPRIGLEQVVLKGVDAETLKNGPGHYSGTPLPGQKGNIGIAGHRVTYTHPFNRLDELKQGDAIILETLDDIYEYKVLWSKTLDPDDLTALMPTRDSRVTLTTCTPKYSAKQRLDVQAVLVKKTPRRPPTLLRRLVDTLAQQPSEQALPKNALDFAIGQAKANVAQSPNDPGARLHLGAIYRNVGRYDEALAEFKKAVELNPSLAQSYYEMSVVYERTGKTNKAIDELNAAIQRDPGLEAAHYRLGNLYLKSRRPELAAATLEKALGLNPFSADTHFHLGQAYEAQGQEDLAKREYEEAIRFVPDYREAVEALDRLNRKP